MIRTEDVTIYLVIKSNQYTDLFLWKWNNKNTIKNLNYRDNVSETHLAKSAYKELAGCFKKTLYSGNAVLQFLLGHHSGEVQEIKWRVFAHTQFWEEHKVHICTSECLSKLRWLIIGCPFLPKSVVPPFIKNLENEFCNCSLLDGWPEAMWRCSMRMYQVTGCTEKRTHFLNLM